MNKLFNLCKVLILFDKFIINYKFDFYEIEKI
jgi:hypothetical protein